LYERFIYEEETKKRLKDEYQRLKKPMNKNAVRDLKKNMIEARRGVNEAMKAVKRARITPAR